MIDPGPAIPMPLVPEVSLKGTQCLGRPSEISFQLTLGTCDVSSMMNMQGLSFISYQDKPIDLTSFLIKITGSDSKELLNGVFSHRSIFRIYNTQGLPDRVTVRVWDPTGTTMIFSFLYFVFLVTFRELKRCNIVRLI